MAQERPISPHLTIYKMQITSVMSISHRLTGAVLSGGGLLLVAWVAALAAGAEHFACMQTLIIHPLGQLVLFGFSLALYYHLFNGIRHLLWDFGYNLSIKGVERTGYVVIAATLILTAVTWLIAYQDIWQEAWQG